MAVNANNGGLSGLHSAMLNMSQLEPTNLNNNNQFQQSDHDVKKSQNVNAGYSSMVIS